VICVDKPEDADGISPRDFQISSILHDRRIQSAQLARAGRWSLRVSTLLRRAMLKIAHHGNVPWWAFLFNGIKMAEHAMSEGIADETSRILPSEESCRFHCEWMIMAKRAIIRGGSNGV
jgi:hypothetical protein